MLWGWERIFVGCFFLVFSLTWIQFFWSRRIVETASSKVTKWFVLGQPLQITFCWFLLWVKLLTNNLSLAHKGEETHKLKSTSWPLSYQVLRESGDKYFKLVCPTKTDRNPALWKLFCSSLCNLKVWISWNSTWNLLNEILFCVPASQN